MDVTSYVDNLGREFAALVATGDEEVREVVERLAGSLEAAIRLMLLEALSAAADEITRELAPGSVELRLRGRDPHFVVTPPPADQPSGETAERGRQIMPSSNAVSLGDGSSGVEDSATARINFRLPEQLKAAIEEAAGQEGRSVNAWLVWVASAALQQRDRDRRTEQRGRRGRQRYTGWVS